MKTSEKTWELAIIIFPTINIDLYIYIKLMFINMRKFVGSKIIIIGIILQIIIAIMAVIKYSGCIFQLLFILAFIFIIVGAILSE
jgi:hypothetical protein